MGKHRLGQTGVRSRGGHLHKGVHSLGHIGNGDTAVRFGGLCADDLPVLDDVEHSAGERVIRIVFFNKPYLHLGVIFKHQGHIGLAVPNKGLLGLADIRAERVALRGCDFLCGVAAQGHILPGNVCQIAACPGNICASKIIVYAGDLNDRSGQPLGGVVRIHLADAALAGDFGGVGEGNGHGGAAVAGENNVLRSRVVDLVACRGLQFGHGIGPRNQRIKGGGSVRARHDLLGVSAVFRGNEKPCAGQALVGIGGIHLFDGQGIFLMGDVQLAYHNGLYIVGGVIAGAGAGVGVLIDLALTPYALRAQVENILRPVTERFAVHFIVNAGIVGMLQVVIDAKQFLGAGRHGVRQQTGLVAPDDSLRPGVHGPGVVAVPYVIYAQGLGLIGKDAGGMGVEVSHHGLYSGVGNGLGIAPGMAFQRPAHALALFSAEAHCAFAIIVEVHLVHIALA